MPGALSPATSHPPAGGVTGRLGSARDVAGTPHRSGVAGEEDTMAEEQVQPQVDEDVPADDGADEGTDLLPDDVELASGPAGGTVDV